MRRTAGNERGGWRRCRRLQATLSAQARREVYSSSSSEARSRVHDQLTVASLSPYAIRDRLYLQLEERLP